MNRKLCFIMFFMIKVAETKNYMGIVDQASFQKSSERFFGIDDSGLSTGFPFDKNFSQRQKLGSLGVLLGYEWRGGRFKNNIELDALIYSFSLIKRKNLRNYDASNNVGVLMESVTIKKTNEFGLTGAVALPVYKNTDFIFGVRGSFARYKMLIDSNLSGSNATEKGWRFGVEPHIGGQYSRCGKFSVRFTAGYNFMSGQRLAIQNYISPAHAPVQASYRFKLGSGINIRGAVLYHF